MTTTKKKNPTLATNVVYTLLPGPTRKRTESPYRYRLIYRNGASCEAGCLLLWEVAGGRTSYQVALERQDNGRLAWHCTCADAIYRGSFTRHLCKHIQGLKALGRREAPATV
jgi:hypothetical protein